MCIRDSQYTGYVKAVVGGRGKKNVSLSLNRATDSTRQPGSTFKILSAYAPAIDTMGYTLSTTIVDEPFSYSNGRAVKNWYSGYRGKVTVRKAIADSMNICAVKTLTDITPQLEMCIRDSRASNTLFSQFLHFFLESY